MGAKLIAVSSDNTTFYTLPGSTGDFSDTTKTVDDTIFGQNYKSTQSDILDWMVTANAVYKGYPGYAVTISQAGTSTSFAAEATTLVTGKTYQITNAAKQVWDPAFPLHVLDNAINEDAQVLSIDYLNGTITFLPSYTIIGPVTVTGHYFPMTQLAKYQKFSLTQSMAAIDNTDIPTAQSNSGQGTFTYGLKTVSLSVDGVYSITNAYRAAVLARATTVITINPDGTGKSTAKGFFKPTTRKQSGNVGALELETMNWELSVPAAGLLTTPFEWNLATSDLSTAVIECLNSFINQSALYVKYLPDGGTTMNAGITGACVVTDITLSGGLASMNEFSVTLQGSGAATTV